MALPTEGTLRAARRWVDLLSRSSVEQGWALIRADARFLDLSPTQYAAALEWLLESGVVEVQRDGRASVVPGGSSDEIARALLAAALRTGNPLWLADSDDLVRTEDDLPQDATELATALSLTDGAVLETIRQVHGQIDLEARARVGSAGEAALVRHLEQRWPGSTRHVALESDGLGYDVACTVNDVTWHLEVKSTTRRGRLLVYLSRHEYEVGRRDDRWRLVVVGLDADLQLERIGVVAAATLESRAPRDVPLGAMWQSARYELGVGDVFGGVEFLANPSDASASASPPQTGGSPFAWLG